MNAQNASLLRRMGAMLYDGLLVLAILFLGTLPFIALRSGEPVDPGSLPYQLTMLLLTFVFFVGFWSYRGCTLGMQSWGLRVERHDGRVPGVAQCSLRYIGALVSWSACGLGFLWQLVDRDKLTWHDRLSGTQLRYYPKDA